MINVKILDKRTALDIAVTLLFDINQTLGAYNQISTIVDWG